MNSASDAYDSAMDAAFDAHSSTLEGISDAFHNSLTDANLDELTSGVTADVAYATAIANAQNALIEGTTTAAANLKSAELASQLAGWTDLESSNTNLDWLNFKKLEADAEVDAWEAVKADFLTAWNGSADGSISGIADLQRQQSLDAVGEYQSYMTGLVSYSRPDAAGGCGQIAAGDGEFYLEHHQQSAHRNGSFTHLGANRMDALTESLI